MEKCDLTIFNVNGNSMFPLLKSNQKVITKRHNFYKKRDIIVFKSGNDMVVHRICKIKKVPSEYFITKGDNMKNTDLPVYRDKIIGKVEALFHGAETITLNSLYFKIIGHLAIIDFLISNKNLKNRYILLIRNFITKIRWKLIKTAFRRL